MLISCTKSPNVMNPRSPNLVLLDPVIVMVVYNSCHLPCNFSKLLCNGFGNLFSFSNNSKLSMISDLMSFFLKLKLKI